MAEPEIIPINPASENAPNNKAPAALHRLRDKAKKLKTPRGKYRCRKCHELPCVCIDPKQSTAGPVSAPAAPSAPREPATPLFNETNSKRLLEASFGIPTVLTQCKIWALTDEEAIELSKPAADVLNEFVSVDPRWVSLSVLTVSLGSIVARKAVLYNAWKRAMAMQNARESQNPTPESKHENPPADVAPESNGNTSEKVPGPSMSMDMLQ